MTNDFDIEKHKADQARARDLGFDYAELSSIINSAHDDGDDGISMGRAIEMIRELGLRAIDKAVTQERADVVAYLRDVERTYYNHGSRLITSVLCQHADAIERGEHLREKKP